MFHTVVFFLLLALLIISSGAALHLGVFKIHREGTGFTKKVIGGILSYLFSGLAWLLMYSYTYLGW